MTDMERFLGALYSIPADLERAEWVRVLMAAHAADIAQEDAEAWSAQADSFNARDFRDVWRSIKPGGGIGRGTLIQMARQHGWRGESPARRPGKAPARPVAPSQTHGGCQPPTALIETLWSQSKPLAGTVATEYLRSRNCFQPPADGDVRGIAALKHRSGHVGAGMLGRITHVVTREPMGLHRTWVNADGTKAAEPGKMTLGPKQGGVIRIWPDEAVTTGLAIAEGIETALSLAHAFQPVWCVIDAGNMSVFPVLAGIECLTIAADNDPAGLRAAEACAARWHAAGREVRIVIPPRAGADINDIAREEAA